MIAAGQGTKAARTGKAALRPVSRSGSHGGTPLRRCAVYTRKSSEEGLEQEYNSLHAQREACEAYVRSQQHEGWRLLPAAYDDGGLSGGSMQRPALQTLLADIRAGRVDTIVVYKVDRLTRSLADFAKMVEVFDAHAVSFVAVTQQFNTTTSMGRLTLNILLSFAQFEREVTGERIRDKIAASKRRGMWMGGRTPLGFQVIDHKLAVIPEDAATVVQLYRRYLELGSVRELKAALDAEGVVSKPRTFSNGAQAGGTPFSRGALYALLSNPVYLGLVRHKDATYPGQHEAIVPAELHAAVQARLAEGNNGGPGTRRAKVQPSLLAGRLFDCGGERLVPSHARKGERRYRYYVSASLLRLSAAQAIDAEAEAIKAPSIKTVPSVIGTNVVMPTKLEGWRLPARELEQAVWAAAAAILRQPSALVPDMLAAGVPPDRIARAMEHLTRLPPDPTASATTTDHGIRPDDLASIVSRVELSPGGMMLTIDTGIQIGSDADAAQQPAVTSAAPRPVADGSSIPADVIHETGTAVAVRADGATFVVSRFVPHRVQRRGMEVRLVIDAPGTPVRDDPALLKVVARAHCWFEDLVKGRAASVQVLAERLGMTTRYVQRVLPLAMLAPALVEQIAAGQHPATLTVDRLTDHGPLPIRWSEQGEHLGD